MAQGVIFSILAGIFVTVQGVFNARLSDQINFWHTNTWVHGTGFLVALTMLMILEGTPNFSNMTNVKPHYLLGGVMGAIIVFSVMKGVSVLGASYAITLLLMAQIVSSLIVSVFGLFGDPTVNLSITQILGLVMMVAGVLLYQLF
ncbi:DMT family transporter [Natranaerobius thermophilus]|uniref:DMT family transporter n=1 Tax=Natranaerobius thermophilus (strain ATCC BAA-1301 / DSM 18059 / JW/NM-WN-LF) TaxID=457570 RepID=B2A886_NATTJ|nr:DMT family transporter [Natranaerobius thermophilus]ACB84452.1 protein of unknown function DUF606 [Natranaerobius thermophilus JW/NM-WN-LF]